MIFITCYSNNSGKSYEYMYQLYTCMCVIAEWKWSPKWGEVLAISESR